MVGSGSSHQPSTLSRCGLPATAFDERPSGLCSTARRALAASRVSRARDMMPIAEWKVPPEAMAPARTTPRTATGPFAASSLTV